MISRSLRDAQGSRAGTDSPRISISETRQLAAGILPTHPIHWTLLALIDAAELLRELHEIECGCDDPGSETRCAWPLTDGALLAGFDFDEEVEHR